MCGIAGIFDYGGAPVDEALLGRMSAALAHRGPDAAGTHLDAGVGLASRRLSIIDVEGGDMPIGNEDGSLQIVFNGAIYNYVELRRDLESRGHRLATRSDTETIVHAYEEYGVECLTRLNGMFAFALWDRRRCELVLARDRMGEKPLFYAEVEGRLLFASEIKALLEARACPREVDAEALDQYLTALYVPYPRTIFRAVAKLPPGHVLRVSRAGKKIERYWFPERIEPRRTSEEEAVSELRSLLADAVRLRLRADVEVGAMLSAGIDSTSVVASAALAAPATRLKTFAVGFEGADWDERPGARLVAERFGTDHHEIGVSLRDVCRTLPRLVWLLDEPMGDAAVVPLAVLASLARRRVKSILCGAGGDELFAGYPRYRIAPGAVSDRWRRAIPARARRGLACAGSLYSAGLGNRVRVALRTVDQRYAEDNAWFVDVERAGLTGTSTRSFARIVGGHYGRPTRADPLNRLMFVDHHTYLSDDLLPMVDRATMGVSLEGRMPFLDPRLVEWAMGLPAAHKLRGGVGKRVLRRAMRGVVPDEILGRPKRGFGPPLDAWLRAGLLDYARKLLLGPRARARGAVDGAFVERLLKSETERTGQQVWTLVVLEIWFRLFLDRDSVTPPPEHLDDLL